MADYSKISDDEFDEAVRNVAARLGMDGVPAIPGVWEIVAEALNNEALDICPSTVDDDADATEKE